MKTLLDKWKLLGQVMADPDLSGSAKSAAYYLLNHFNLKTEQCDPSLLGLAEQMGKHERSALRAVNELVKKGVFERAQGGGRGRTTKYKPLWETPTELSLNTDKTVRKTPTKLSDEYGKENGKEDGNKNLDQIGFSDFWKHYPKKVARGAAEKAYLTALKKTDQMTILAGVMRYAALRTGQDPQFTKHPATWLNSKCWADEPSHFDGGTDARRKHTGNAAYVEVASDLARKYDADNAASRDTSHADNNSPVG
jgi:hypothetical protein